MPIQKQRSISVGIAQELSLYIYHQHIYTEANSITYQEWGRTGPGGGARSQKANWKRHRKRVDIQRPASPCYVQTYEGRLGKHALRKVPFRSFLVTGTLGRGTGFRCWAWPEIWTWAREISKSCLFFCNLGASCSCVCVGLNSWLLVK